jgi:hypothetical protein
MSKINPLQAAALSNSANTVGSASTKSTPESSVTTKSASDKKKISVANKTPAKKTVVAKSNTTKPVAKAKTAVETKAVKTNTATPVKAATKAAKVAKPVKATNPVKEKTPKLKMERDSFTMPKVEYAQLYVLKERLIKLGQASKKSELLRAGIMQLTAMTDAALIAAMAKVPAIKTGRPKKK